MIQDSKRVEAIRAKAAEQIGIVEGLKSRIGKGKFERLDVLGYQLDDIETMFLASLDDQDRTARQEAEWLNGAERILNIVAPQVMKIKADFDKFGNNPIKVVGR